MFKQAQVLYMFKQAQVLYMFKQAQVLYMFKQAQVLYMFKKGLTLCSSSTKEVAPPAAMAAAEAFFISVLATDFPLEHYTCT